MRYLLPMIGFILLTSNVWGRECTTQEAYDAETKAIDVDDWGSLYISFKNYGHCDDGAIAEGFDDVTVRLLINDWPGFFTHNAIWANDRGFQRFVIRHVGELASVEESNQIFTKAKHDCPKNKVNFCRKLAAKARVSEAEVENEQSNPSIKRDAALTRTAPYVKR